MNRIIKYNKNLVIKISILLFFSFIIVNPIFAEETYINAVDNNLENLKEISKIKLEIANEKENAYNQAINGVNFWIKFFGGILVIIAIGFGWWRDNKIKEAKGEILKDIDDKKEFLEKENLLKLKDIVMTLKIELEKYRNEKIEEIKKETEGNIKDIQKRLKKLENKNSMKEDENIDIEDENFEKENPKNLNPYL